jgi:gliding motility-associated-like protein
MMTNQTSPIEQNSVMEKKTSIQLIVLKKIALLVFLILTNICRAFGQDAAYLTSDGEPWGQTAIIQAFKTIYGSEGTGWSKFLYGTSASAIFNAARKVVFIEGGDTNTMVMKDFLDDNWTAISSWVSKGNTLIVDAASNEELGNFEIGNSGVYSNRVLTSTMMAAIPTHPILMNSTYPAYSAGNYSANFVAHNVITGNYTASVFTCSGGNTMVEKTIGSGRMLVSGCTLPWFFEGNYAWFPQPNMQYLLKSIIAWAKDLSSGSQILTGNTSTNRLIFGIQPENCNAGANIPLSVSITDEYGNILTSSSAAVTISIQNNSSTGKTGVLYGTLTVKAVKGVATFSDLSINKIGIGYTLTAISPDATSSQPVSNSFDVTSATVNYLKVTGSGVQDAGEKQTITVTAFDIFNNVASNYNGLKTLIFSGANSSQGQMDNPIIEGVGFGLETILDFTSGVATTQMTLFKTETAEITTTDGTINADEHKLEVLVNPAPLKNFIVSGIASPNTVGSLQSVTVEAIDAYNNLKTNYSGRITFSNTDNKSKNPDDYQFLPGDNGTHTFKNNLQFGESGSWTLTVLDTNEPGKTGYQTTITEKRTITISSVDMSKTYGTDFTFTGTEFSIQGTLASGESITHVDLNSDGVSTDANAGSYKISAENATGDGGFIASNYNIIYASDGILRVEKIPQIISFSDLPDKMNVNDVYPIEASSTSGLEVLFESADDNVAIVRGNQCTGEAKGIAKIRAYCPGDQNYLPAEKFADVEIVPTRGNILHLFTPNNDGINDTWVIPDLDSYGKCEVRIYSRQGKEVYANKSYDNLWDGRSNGVPLPEGTYYFLMKTQYSGAITGMVSIIR